MPTSRSVNDCGCTRASLTGVRPTLTSSRAPCGTAAVRRPSQVTTASPVPGTISNATRGARAHHQGSGEERMGADRDDEQRFDVRPDDRATGAERVRGRAGGGRAHHTVAGPSRERATLDLEHAFDHPAALILLQRGLVERPVRPQQLAADARRDLDGHALLDVVVTGDDPLDHRRERFGLGLGQKADMAEIDPEQRHPVRPRQFGAAQQAAVAAEHQDEFGAIGGVSISLDDLRARQVERTGFIGEHPRGDVRRAEHVEHLLDAVMRRDAPGMGDDQNLAIHPASHPSWRRQAASRKAGDPMQKATARTPGCLPDPASELCTSPRTPKPSSPATAATPRIAPALACGSRTTPPRPTCSRPTSNCGFTSTTRSPSGSTHPSRAGNTSRSEMKDRSATTSSTRPPMSSGERWRTLVRSRTLTRSSLAAARSAARSRRRRRQPPGRLRAAARR